MTFLRPDALWLCLLAPVISLFVAAIVRRDRRLFRDWNLTEKSRPGSDAFHAGGVGGACLCLFVALARPVWDPRPIEMEAVGQDAVFMVDVSRSMLTADLDGGQTRLAAVKQAILDLLPGLTGDRVALLAFAGTSVVKCPLTTDTAYFAEAVRLLETASTARGGTLLGDALRRVKADFVKPDRALAIWIFTDGGDQESFPVNAARDLADADVGLFVWGVGSIAGGIVPDRDVSSVLNEDLLKQLAAALPRSAYWGADVPLWRLPEIYREQYRPTSVRTTKRVVWREGAWWLLWPSLVLVIAAYRPRRSSRRLDRRPSRPTATPKPPVRAISGLLALIAVFANVACSVKTTEAWESPADPKRLIELETETLKKTLSAERRAELFFLWGQELAVQFQTGSASPGGSSSAGSATDAAASAKARQRAIGAFEKVIDLNAGLVDESRFNLELLLRAEESEGQKGQDQKSEQPNNDQKTGDQQNADQQNADQQNADQQNADQQNADQQNGEKQNAADEQRAATSERQTATEESANEGVRDLSALVREKEDESDLNEALERERTRIEERQAFRPGTIAPVERDW